MSTCLLLNRGYIPLRGKPKRPATTPLGRWIDDNMERRGLTVRGLADAAGVSGPRITQIRHGDTTTRDMIERLSRAFSQSNSSEYTETLTLSEGLKAGGFIDSDRIDYDPDLDLQVVIEAYRGASDTDRAHILSAAEIALRASRAGSVGSKAGD